MLHSKKSYLKSGFQSGNFLFPVRQLHLLSSQRTNKLIIPKYKHLSQTTNTINTDTDLNITHSSISTGNNRHYINIELNASTPVVKPTTFVCAIDISGSMDGPSTYGSDLEESKFSRLDLVKHSINTIIHCLRPEDTLGLVTFSDGASKVLSLTKMDERGKKSAANVLQRFQSHGNTNLWSGLKTSLEEMESCYGNNTNKFTLLLTDGEPNINPVKGIYREFLERNTQFPIMTGLHTFGYGYGLDSNLLADLSKTGGGLFAHIPDHTMCNTVFINFLSNCLSTSIDRVEMNLKSVHGCNYVNILGNSMINNKLNIGAIQSGQPQNILLETGINNTNNFKICLDFDYHGKQIPYVIDKLQDGPISKNISTDLILYLDNSQIEQILSVKDMIYQLPKTMLVNIIQKGLTENNLSTTCTLLNTLCNIIEKFISNIPKNSADSLKLHALLRNIKSQDMHDGQIYKAFSRQDWYERWGVHYLKYFMRSHQLQICSNFKDPSLQHYGGQLFKELRSEIEDIFSQIPVPKPSLSSQSYTGNFSSSFYTASNPCIDGNGSVKLSNGGEKLVENLQKGDTIINSDGNISTILCVLKTSVKNGNTSLSIFNGVRVTPYHPIRINKKWNFPCKLKEPMHLHCDYVYSFVLDKHHIMTVNDIDTITLGHGFTYDPIIEHPFFGTNKVIDNLKTRSGWDKGLIEIHEYKPSYDSNGLISSLF